MVLGYSRIKYVKLTTDREQKALFKCMISGFSYFQGIPQEILFDNMKTVVDRSKSTFSSVEFNKIFKHFANDAECESVIKVNKFYKLNVRLLPTEIYFAIPTNSKLSNSH